MNETIWICRMCGEEYKKPPPFCKICNGKEFQEVEYIDLWKITEFEKQLIKDRTKIIK